MTIDLEKLKQAALAATPGPWVSDWDDDECQPLEPDEYIDVSVWQEKAFEGRFINNICFDNTIANGNYIAAANPEAVLELIARLREAEKDAASKQARIDSLMLEYCPNEMTEEQLRIWGENQAAIKESEK